MTGVLNALAGQGGGLRYTVTIGNFATDNYGYSQGAAGAISPSSYTGATIIQCANDSAPVDTFTVTLSGVRAQSFFRGVEIQATDGSIVTLFTSGATSYSNDGTNSFWQWQNDIPTWTATTPATRLIRIF